MGKEIDEQYNDEEARRRFEAALRGARVGHESMKDISPKRAGKRKAKVETGERPASNGRVHKGRTRG